MHVSEHVPAAPAHRNYAVHCRVQRPERTVPTRVLRVARLAAYLAVAMPQLVRQRLPRYRRVVINPVLSGTSAVRSVAPAVLARALASRRTVHMALVRAVEHAAACRAYALLCVFLRFAPCYLGFALVFRAVPRDALAIEADVVVVLFREELLRGRLLFLAAAPAPYSQLFQLRAVATDVLVHLRAGVCGKPRDEVRLADL